VPARKSVAPADTSHEALALATLLQMLVEGRLSGQNAIVARDVIVTSFQGKDVMIEILQQRLSVADIKSRDDAEMIKVLTLQNQKLKHSVPPGPVVEVPWRDTVVAALASSPLGESMYRAAGGMPKQWVTALKSIADAIIAEDLPS
jgi:hypothetical protein